LVRQTHLIKSGNDTHLTSDANTNRRTLLQAHCLVACAFTPHLGSTREFIQKTTILIPSASSFLAAAPCGCLILNMNVQSPRCCHTPHPSPLACPRRACLSPPPVSHARVLVMFAPPITCVACLAEQAQCWWHWWRWCSRALLVLDASGARRRLPHSDRYNRPAQALPTPLC
jgi:hypothetical protein